MAIGAITVGTQAGKSALDPIRIIPVSFAGDGAYGAGGTAAFEDSVQTILGESVTLLGVISLDCGGYVPVYDRAADKLKVYEGDYNPAAVGPLTENATADLSGVTFSMLVVCQ